MTVPPAAAAETVFLAHVIVTIKAVVFAASTNLFSIVSSVVICTVAFRIKVDVLYSENGHTRSMNFNDRFFPKF